MAALAGAYRLRLGRNVVLRVRSNKSLWFLWLFIAFSFISISILSATFCCFQWGRTTGYRSVSSSADRQWSDPNILSGALTTRFIIYFALLYKVQLLADQYISNLPAIYIPYNNKLINVKNNLFHRLISLRIRFCFSWQIKCKQKSG